MHGLDLLLSPVLHVLLHVEGGAALSVNKAVIDGELLLEVGLELNHLCQGHSVVLSTTVQPQLVDHGLLDTVRGAQFVIIQVYSHELFLCD